MNIIVLVLEILVAIVIIALFLSLVFPALCHVGVSSLCNLPTLSNL